MKLGLPKVKFRQLLRRGIHAVLLLFLVIQAGFIAGLLSYGYLPIPALWGNALIAKYGPQDLHIEVSAIRIHPGLQIELLGLHLHSSMLSDPLLTASEAELQLGLIPQRHYQPGVKGLTVNNATLYLPPVYAPSGQRTRLLERMAFHLTPGNERIRIDSFAALHDEIRLRGQIEWPLHSISPEAGRTSAARTNRFINRSYELIAQALKAKERINVLARPTLNFQLQMLDDSSVQISTRLSSRTLQHTEITGQNIWIDTEFQLKAGQLNSSSSIQFHAGELLLPRLKATVRSAYGQISQQDWSALENGDWPELELCAQELTIQDLKLDAPKIRIDPNDYPHLQVSGSSDGLHGAAAFSAVLDVEEKSARIQAQGSVDLIGLIPPAAAAKLPELQFNQAPYYQLAAEFKPGFQLDSIQVKAQVNQLSVGGIAFDHMQAACHFDADRLSIDHLYLRRDQQWLDLKFSLDRSSDDYRLALQGSAIPDEYNALLPGWWARIFRDFDFSQAKSSYGDFIIRGNTRRRAADLYYGYAEAQQVAFRGVQLEAADLIVRGRGHYAEVHNLNARRGDDWAHGNIAFASLADEIRAPLSIRLEFDAQLPLRDTEKLFGPNIARILSDFESDQSPTAHFSAAIFNSAYPQHQGKTYFDLNANSNGPLRFKQVPLDQLQFKLYGRKQTTYLRDLSFGFAGGSGQAQIDIETVEDSSPLIRLNLQLQDANKQQALVNLAPLTGGTIADEPRRPDSAPTQLNFNLHAQGPAQNPYQYQGYGDIEIKDPNLGSIKLLGPLSTLLEKTPLSFTSFSLDTLQAKFKLDHETVHLNPLVIDGPSTQILAPGKLRIDTQQLDMRVSVSLFANLGDPKSPIKRFSDFIQSPLPNLLQFELSGTLAKPRWRSLYDPRNLIPQLW